MTGELRPAWVPARVSEFWRFVAERHEVFIRRVVERQPPPWTDDPAIAGAHYTNVYRELDRVTRDLVAEVLGPSRKDPPEDRLFNVILYRAFNLPETYRLLGGYRPAREWDLRRAARLLLREGRAGRKVFTGAFIVNGTGGRWSGPGGKARLWIYRLREVRDQLNPLWAVLAATQALDDRREGMREAHRHLARLPGIGGFLAYEILVDLCYEPRVLHYSENDWVHAGPGAQRGLGVLLRRRPPSWEGAIRELWATQREARQRAGAELRGPDLTLRNVEHSLCEASKWFRLRRGIRPKRRYRPEMANRDLTPWEGVDAAYLSRLEALKEKGDVYGTHADRPSGT